MEEQWKQLTDYTKYEVSNTGKLRNILTQKIIKPIIGGFGYVQYGFRNTPGENPHTRLVHRYIAIAFIPNPDNLPQVNHKDGVKSNNHIDNLEWVNASRNKLHAYEIGLCEKARESSRKTINKINKGEASNMSKWTNEQILEIRELLSNGTHVTVIMNTYSMSYSNVYKIKNRNLWKHI